MITNSESENSHLQSPDRDSHTSMSDSDYVDADEKVERMEKTLHKYSKYISDQQTLIEQLQNSLKTQQEEFNEFIAKYKELEEVNKHHLITIRKLQIKLHNPPLQQAMDTESNTTQARDEFPPLNSQKTKKRPASPETSPSSSQQRQKQSHQQVSTGTVNNTTQNSNSDKPKEKTPPIVLRNKDIFNKVTVYLKEARIIIV